ncbi:hypothetical protein [Sphingobacterium corticibacterium]|nr:hypothetical protein [Sphingobacterium corticibacterium]
MQTNTFSRPVCIPHNNSSLATEYFGRSSNYFTRMMTINMAHQTV